MGICLERMRYKYRGFRTKVYFSPLILDQLLLKHNITPPILRKSFMSISPTHLQRSESSSSSTALPHNPTSLDDGLLLQPSSNLLVGSPTSNSEATQTFQSLQISGRFNSSSNRTPGSMDAATADSGRPSKKMSEGRTSYGRRNSNHQHHGNYPQHRPAGRGQGGISSQFRHHQVAEETSAVASSQQHPSNSNSAARRSNSTNANHLLNFHYDRVSRPQPRAPPPRRQQKKIKPYNKDLFLQANFKFVVLDSGNSAMESTDPDKMLQWENVICVKYSTPFPVQCPICLESPLCPQITSCGHIFCFPCILQYLLMGVEDHKGECWKKCPLCFMMISSKDLYTIYIENVSHYCVGDTIQFTLLTREKNSLFPSEKNQGLDSMADGSVDFCDSFSKFISTSDVELSVREACLELKDWLARADSGLVDNLEQLPYVCAALEQLEQRKKFWAEIQLSCSPPSRSPTTHLSMKGQKYSAKTEPHTFSSNSKGVVDSEVYEPNNVTQTGNPSEGEEKVLSSSCDEEKFLRRVSNDSQHMKENDSYSFYQAVDGQHLILHPLNMKCLLHYYGSYDLLPHRISGEILQLETVTQSEAIRRRYRYLSHFSLTTTFQLCEIDMTKILPPDALAPFIDEIKKRENQRKRLAKKEHLEKVKAEAAAMHAMPIPFNFGPSSLTENTFSMDDFEALGSSPVPSTSPPAANERTTFSNVTRLGFAAAYDSPSLKVDDSATAASSNTEDSGETSSVAGQRNMVTLSFSDIMSTPKSSESVDVPKMNALGGKKGKKPTRVLLSTAGGRRY